MTQIRKMYVIPSELFDSVFLKNKLTESPILTAQVVTEKEKANLKSLDNDQAVVQFNELSHQQEAYNEQRKNQENTPLKVSIVDTTPTFSIDKGNHERKKRTIKLSRRRTKPFQRRLRSSFLDKFYDFEPTLINEERMEKSVVAEPKPSAVRLISPKRTRSRKIY